MKGRRLRFALECREHALEGLKARGRGTETIAGPPEFRERGAKSSRLNLLETPRVIRCWLCKGLGNPLRSARFTKRCSDAGGLLLVVLVTQWPTDFILFSMFC